MNTHTLAMLLRIAAVMHLGLLCAGLMMPQVVGIERELRGGPTFVRSLFWVYYSFIGFCLVCFGIITFGLAEVLADGSMLSRSICVFFGGFWTLRLIAAAFVLDLSPYLTNGFRRVGYYLTNVVFTFLPVIYFLAAWKGGTR